jgi:hypothetical protein
LANPDLGRIVKTVEMRTRPVVIAEQPDHRAVLGAPQGQRKIVYEGVVG